MGLIEGEENRMFEFDYTGEELEKWRKGFMMTRPPLHCISADDTWIQGTYSSSVGRMLLIRINKCSDRDDCLDDAEMKSFFRGRYLSFWFNGIRFEPSMFGEQSIIKKVKQS